MQTILMHFEELVKAPLLTQLHIIFASLGIIIGGSQFLLKKGSKRHKTIGWVWVIIMALVGLSALFLPERKQGTIPLTLLLTLWVAIGLPLAIRAIKRGNILLHRAYMLGLYIGGLFIALAFTITPGRLLYKVFFNG